MSSLNKVPRTIKADLGGMLEKYALILTLSSLFARVFCAFQVEDLSAAQGNLKAANAVITRADQNLTVEKNIDQPSSLNYTDGYTPQGASKHVARYLNAAEQVISKKINSFTAAKNFFNFSVVLGFILQVLAFFLPDHEERGRRKQT